MFRCAARAHTGRKRWRHARRAAGMIRGANGSFVVDLRSDGDEHVAAGAAELAAARAPAQAALLAGVARHQSRVANVDHRAQTIDAHRHDVARALRAIGNRAARGVLALAEPSLNLGHVAAIERDRFVRRARSTQLATASFAKRALGARSACAPFGGQHRAAGARSARGSRRSRARRSSAWSGALDAARESGRAADRSGTGAARRAAGCARAVVGVFRGVTAAGNAQRQAESGADRERIQSL